MDLKLTVFRTVNRMKIDYKLTQDLFNPNDSVRIQISVQNTYNSDIDFIIISFLLACAWYFYRGRK